MITSSSVTMAKSRCLTFMALLRTPILLETTLALNHILRHSSHLLLGFLHRRGPPPSPYQLCLFSSPCGFVDCVDEMINSESFSAMYIFLLKHYPVLPPFIAYDFGCGFGKFVAKRQKGSYFENTQFVIDNFHARGHIVC